MTTPRLVKGENLSDAQITQVKAAFAHRPTVENNYPRRNPYGLRIPAVTDEQWIREHAFYIRASDGKLADKPHYCEPFYLAK